MSAVVLPLKCVSETLVLTYFVKRSHSLNQSGLKLGTSASASSSWVFMSLLPHPAAVISFVGFIYIWRYCLVSCDSLRMLGPGSVELLLEGVILLEEMCHWREGLGDPTPSCLRMHSLFLALCGWRCRTLSSSCTKPTWILPCSRLDDTGLNLWTCKPTPIKCPCKSQHNLGDLVCSCHGVNGVELGHYAPWQVSSYQMSHLASPISFSSFFETRSHVAQVGQGWSCSPEPSRCWDYRYVSWPCLRLQRWYCE